MQYACDVSSIWISAAPLGNLIVTYGLVAIIQADIWFAVFFRGLELNESNLQRRPHCSKSGGPGFSLSCLLKGVWVNWRERRGLGSIRSVRLQRSKAGALGPWRNSGWPQVAYFKSDNATSTYELVPKQGHYLPHRNGTYL